MVRTVARYLLLALILVLILIWFVGGGIGKVESVAKDFTAASLLQGVGGFQLPWALPIPQGPNFSTSTATESSVQPSGTSQSQTFGNQSQYEGAVTLLSTGAAASDPQAEYLVIENSGGQTIDVSGWSLQSAQTGARAYIPLGASFFQVGELNQQNDIELGPGAVAIVTSGVSPVGTSFRENECSGYLEHLQSFTPALETQCPSPSNNASQAASYGASCSAYVSSLPFCTFPQNFPSGISSSCEAYAQTTFSYNGCVTQYQNDPNFALGDWRVYLNATRELWNNDHDTIRLLDTQGQVVAVTSY